MQAAELGRWGVARTVFEHGLRRHPGRAIMAEKLAEVVMQLGDWQAAQPILARMLVQDPAHPRALQLLRLVKAAAAPPAHQGNIFPCILHGNHRVCRACLYMRACMITVCIALKLVLTDRDCAGDGLKAHAPPFRKRMPAAGRSTPGQASTTVLTAPTATWSALLCAVMTMLRAPRALPASQVMHSVRMTIPPEQRQPVVAVEGPEVDQGMEARPTRGSHPLTEGISVSAAHGAKTVARAAAAQALGKDSLSLQPSDPNISVQPTQDGETSLQIGHPSGHVLQRENRDSSEPEKAAPARASRRLEARRWARCSLHVHSCIVPRIA